MTSSSIRVRWFWWIPLSVSTIWKRIAGRESGFYEWNSETCVCLVDLQAEVLKSCLNGVTERWQALHTGELVNSSTLLQTSSLNPHQNPEGRYFTTTYRSGDSERLKDYTVSPEEFNEKLHAKSQLLAYSNCSCHIISCFFLMCWGSPSEQRAGPFLRCFETILCARRKKTLGLLYLVIVK